MKRLTVVSVLMLALIVSTSAFGWSGQWGNVYPFGGGPSMQCPPIVPGSLVQLIHAGPDGLIDDPVEFYWAQQSHDPWVALLDWVDSGVPPVGDDTLRDETVFQDYGPGFDGYFGKSIEGSDSELGDPWYTRYYDSPKSELVGWYDCYGEVGDRDDPNDPIYELELTGWDGEKYQFGDYTIRIQGECTDKIVMTPEPSTIAIGGIALLLAFFRKKK